MLSALVRIALPWTVGISKENFTPNSMVHQLGYDISLCIGQIHAIANAAPSNAQLAYVNAKLVYEP